MSPAFPPPLRLHAYIPLLWLWLWLLLQTPIASALSWHSLAYELGFFGPHPTTRYESVDLAAPEVDMLQWDPRCEDGYVLLSPRGAFYPQPGPLIYDDRGNLVWMESRFGMVMDLKVQEYRGEDYITFWAGEDDGVRGLGSYYMLNSSYEVTHIVSAANGHTGDVHEFKLTDDGTVLITIYEIAPADLSVIDGPTDGWIYDSLFQEIDIESGALLFQWRARDHYAIEETYYFLEEDRGVSPDAPYDYFHINSVDKHPVTGNYLVSSRYMHTVTCITPSGEILWVLGGKRNMFALAEEAEGDDDAVSFTWQHDARWVPASVAAFGSSHSDNEYRSEVQEITLLDNGAHEHLRTSDHTRGYHIALNFSSATPSSQEEDGKRWTAKTLTTYSSPGRFSAHSQGNLQLLPGTGNAFIGWGKASAYTEFAPDGTVLCDAHWGPRAFFWFGWIKSYRAFKTSRWVGRPTIPPDVAVDELAREVYVSWNGATDVAGWVLQRQDYYTSERNSTTGDGGGEGGGFETVVYTPKRGFETKIDVSGTDGYLRLVAMTRQGEKIGWSEVFTVSHVTSETTPFLSPFEEDIHQALLGACALGAILAAIWKSRRGVSLLCDSLPFLPLR